MFNKEKKPKKPIKLVIGNNESCPRIIVAAKKVTVLTLHIAT